MDTFINEVIPNTSTGQLLCKKRYVLSVTSAALVRISLAALLEKDMHSGDAHAMQVRRYKCSRAIMGMPDFSSWEASYTPGLEHMVALSEWLLND